MLCEHPSIAFITETWFSDNVTESSLLHGLNNYHLHRCDRFLTCGGDVCIIINSDVCQFKSTSSKAAFDYSIAQAIECVGNYHVINTICCYLPPTTGSVQNDLLHINSFVNDISSMLDKKVPNYIVGNFNLRVINWTNPCTLGNRPEQCFTNFILANHFELFVSEPTRVDSSLTIIEILSMTSQSLTHSPQAIIILSNSAYYFTKLVR